MAAEIVSRERWLALRGETIGSSEAAIACGESRYCSPLELWAQRQGLVEKPDLSNNRAVRRGNAMEPFILAEYEIESGRTLLPLKTTGDLERVEQILTADGNCRVVCWVLTETGRPQVHVRSTRYDFMSATLDGGSIDESLGLEIVESKSLGWRQIRDYGDEESGLAPAEHRLQILHDMAVCPAAASAALAVAIGADDFRLVRELCTAPSIKLASIVALEREFIRCVREGDPPTLVGSAPDSTRATLRAMHPKDSGRSVVLGKDALALHKRFDRLYAKHAAATSAATALKKRLDPLRAELELMLGDASVGELPDGSGRYVIKTVRNGGYTVAPFSYRNLTFEQPNAQKRRKTA